MNNKIFNKKKNKGFTLVELVVTVAILSIVMIIVTNFFLYNNRIFRKSDSLSQVQFDVRMASDYITTELRNVENVSLVNDTLGNSIDLTLVSSKYPNVTGVNFSIRSLSGKYLVIYTVEGNDVTHQNYFKLDSEVLLNNVTSIAEVLDEDEDSDIIYYKRLVISSNN